MALSLPAIIGKIYRVEYKNNLHDSAWTPVGTDRLANSATLTVEDNIGGNRQRFYRVLVLD